MMFLLTCLLPSSFSPPRAALMPEMVHPILDRMAAKWNMSFQLGFVDAEGTVALAAGKDDIWDPHGPTPLTNTTRIPLGSVSKPWTALRVMQHVEAGTIQLDDPAHTWIDPVLARLSPQGPPSMERMSMARLWGPAARNVTVRMLLGMTSGFLDYVRCCPHALVCMCSTSASACAPRPTR